MVVTSAIFWLLFAICIVVIYNTNYSFSAKMTYGLVYRPVSPQAASSDAQEVAVQSSTAEPSEPYASYVPNETKITTQTEQAPTTTTTQRSSISFTTNLDAQNFSSSAVTGNLKYSKKDVPAWMVQNGVVAHQYQVYENDSDAEG